MCAEDWSAVSAPQTQQAAGPCHAIVRYPNFNPQVLDKYGHEMSRKLVLRENAGGTVMGKGILEVCSSQAIAPL